MLVDPYKLGKSDGRSMGKRDGIRAAITWLLNRAREMNDQNAKDVLNSAAFSLGQDLKYRESMLPQSHRRAPVRYKVPCWNCDGEGNIEPFDEWDADRCSHCAGKGFLVVTELTDDNCQDAIPIHAAVGEVGNGS